MSRTSECQRTGEWRRVYPQHAILVDALSPQLVHRNGDNVVKSLAESFRRQTGRMTISLGENIVLAEDAQEMLVDVICNALSAQPDVRNGWSSRAALEGHVEGVTSMLTAFPDDSSKEKVIAAAQLVKASFGLQKEGVFDLNTQKALEALKPGIDRLARALDLSEKEGKRRPGIFVQLLDPSEVGLKPAIA